MTLARGVWGRGGDRVDGYGGGGGWLQYGGGVVVVVVVVCVCVCVSCVLCHYVESPLGKY